MLVIYLHFRPRRRDLSSLFLPIFVLSVIFVNKIRCSTFRMCLVFFQKDCVCNICIHQNNFVNLHFKGIVYDTFNTKSPYGSG